MTLELSETGLQSLEPFQSRLEYRVDSMTDYWPQIITGAAGLVGSIIGTVGALYAQRRKGTEELRQQRRALGFALAAEIEAYLDLMARRKWVAQAEHLLALARSGKRPRVNRWLTEEEQSAELFPIFAANMSNIGLVGDSCRELGTFYTSVNAIRTTVMELQRGKYDEMDLPSLAGLIQEETDFWHEAVIVGRRVVVQLRAS